MHSIYIKLVKEFEKVLSLFRIKSEKRGHAEKNDKFSFFSSVREDSN